MFKKESGEIYWLIIKPKPSPDFPSDRWQLPKGMIEKGENSESAAVREVREETGVEAKIIEKVDTSKYVLTFVKTNLYPDNKVFKIVTWYVMEYVSGEARADNKETEEVFWAPFEKALKTLSFSSEKQVLKKASEVIN